MIQEEKSISTNSDTVYSSDILRKSPFVKKPIHFKILTASFILFTVIWVIVVLGKFYSLHSYVFDLGFIMQRLWQPYHIFSINFELYVLFSSGFQYILSPLYFFHSFQLLLIVQVIAIGVSCFPLYGIAVKKLKSTLYASAISIIYLFYFPLSGVLWFDVHFQAFFIPLFIFAYYFYINGRYRFATLLFIISGTTRFPYMIFPFLFSIFELYNYFLLDKKILIKPSKKRYIILIFIISTLFLLGGVYFDLLIPQSSIIAFSNTTFSERLVSMVLTFIFIFGPLLFLPIFRLRWLIMSMPLFLLGLYSGNPSYTFPMIMQEQYSSMIIPIVFIGLIEAFEGTNAEFTRTTYLKKIKLHLNLFKKYTLVRTNIVKNEKGILVFILAIIFIGSAFYQPYSPVNYTNSIVYNTDKDVSFNSTNYNILMTMMHFIPKNNPYVLFQNDMPELLPRPQVANLTFLFTSYIPNNITLGEVINNTFPIFSDNGHYVFTKVDYLIAYTQSSQYYLQFNGKESTLPQILSMMISSKKYGIVAEDRGFILVERGYIGTPKIYKPLIVNSPFNISNSNGSSTYRNLFSNRISSAFVTLVPGNYTVRYYISLSNNSPLSFIHGELGYNNGAELSNSFNVSASYFRLLNSKKAIAFNITVPNQESHAVFIISSFDFVGSLTIYNVSLVQTSY